MARLHRTASTTLLSTFVGNCLKGQNKLGEDGALLKTFGRIKQLAPALTGGIDHCKRGRMDFSRAGRVAGLLTATTTLGAHRNLFLTSLSRPVLVAGRCKYRTGKGTAKRGQKTTCLYMRKQFEHRQTC